MTDFIEFQELRVRVIRSARRNSLGLTVREGEAIVRMPKRLALKHAESFIAQKAVWLRSKLEKYPAAEPKRYDDGDHFLYLGKTLALKFKLKQTRNYIHIVDDTLRLDSRASVHDTTTIKKQLTRWYRQQADTYLKERVEILSQQTDLQPASVQVRQYKARWGSCKINGDIQLNWKLIMAPPTVIDYVIIHELCHLEQHNHSPTFWALVESFEPNYKKLRGWLKNNGHLLVT